MENNADSAPPQQSPPMRYMIQLDALRAIAVFGVLSQHFLPQDVFLNSKLHWGPLGVKLFFVLSGFLITGILLRCKDLISFNNQDVWFTIKRFYLRRCLRLMPIYYIAILVALLTNPNLVKKSLLWHLTYTSNIYFSFHDWDIITSHFWSLSVEEQFYLFWALLILLLPQKYLLTAIAITVAIGPVFRFWVSETGLGNGNGEYILTFSCFDSLGMGALLAYFSQQQEQFKQARKHLIMVCFWIGIPSFVVFNLMYISSIKESVLLMISHLSASLFFTWLIARAAQGFSGLTGAFLETKPLAYLGKISYGIYVYHLLVPNVSYNVFTYFGIPVSDSTWVNFAISTVITVIVAALSWELLEKPISSLKKYFEYKKEVRIDDKC